MAVEKIDSLYDVQAINAEQQQVIGAIDATQAKLISLWSSIQTNNKSTVLDIAPNANELSTAINNLSQKINALSTNLNVMRQAAKSSAGGLTDLEKAERDLAKSLSPVNEKIQGFKAQTEAANKAAKAAAKEALGLNDEYQKLTNTYNELQRVAKNTGVQFGTNSEQFKTAAAAANAVSNQLKEIDAGVGQFGKNVGNYKSGFAGVGQALDKVLGPFRQAAYILPGVGLSGIFGGIASAIGAAVVAMGLFSDKATEASLSADVLGKAFHSDDYKNATKNIEELTINIDLAKKGFLNKTEVLKQYNDTLGKTIGQATSLDEAEHLLVKNGDAYVKMTLFKAAANQALDKAAKAALETEEKRNKTAQDFESIKTNASVFGAGQISAPGFVPSLNDVNKGIQARAAAAEKSRQAAIKEGEKDQKTYEDIAKKFQEQAAKIASQNKFNFFGGKMDPKEVKEKTDKSAKAEYDALKAGLEAEAKLRQSFADNQASFGEQTAIEQAKQASALRMQIIDLENKHDLDQKGLTQDAKDAINKRDADKRIQEEITLQANIAKIQKQARDNQLKEDEKLQKELATQNPETPEFQAGTSRMSRIREEVSIQQGILADATDTLTIESSKQLDILNQQYIKGTISLEDYEKKKKKLTEQYSKERLKLLLAELEAELDIYEKAGLGATESANKVRAAIAAAKKGISDVDAGEQSDKLKDLISDLEKANKAAELFGQTITTINDIGYEKQKAQLESLENQQEKNYEKEVENINNSSDTEEQKANKLKILESQRQSQKEQNERKQRQLDNQKARFDKAASIMSIITQTALAVVKSLPNIGLAILSGALGAAQLAKAIATPVPQYAEGTQGHKGGLAWVGDGGEHELVQENGRSWITPNTPTLVNLAKGAKVTPLSDDLNKAMYNTMLIKTGNNMRSTEDMSIREQTRALAKAFKNNKPSVVNKINVDFGKFQYIQSQIKN